MTQYLLVSLMGIGLIGKAVHTMYFSEKKVPKEEEKLVINEVLFFPDEEYPCDTITKSLASSSRNVCYKQSCRRLHGRPSEPQSSMLKFLEYLANAKTKVDLCIYLLTEPILARILIDLHKRNVRIRIITECSWDQTTGGPMNRLRENGISIRYNKRGTGALMHHKFLVIDDNILLTGSFNWTGKAVVSNYEAVLITSVGNVVKSFVDKFDEMWPSFSNKP